METSIKEGVLAIAKRLVLEINDENLRIKSLLFLGEGYFKHSSRAVAHDIFESCFIIFSSCGNYSNLRKLLLRGPEFGFTEECMLRRFEHLKTNKKNIFLFRVQQRIRALNKGRNFEREKSLKKPLKNIPTQLFGSNEISSNTPDYLYKLYLRLAHLITSNSISKAIEIQWVCKHWYAFKDCYHDCIDKGGAVNGSDVLFLFAEYFAAYHKVSLLKESIEHYVKAWGHAEPFIEIVSKLIKSRKMYHNDFLEFFKEIDHGSFEAIIASLVRALIVDENYPSAIEIANKLDADRARALIVNIALENINDFRAEGVSILSDKVHSLGQSQQGV